MTSTTAIVMSSSERQGGGFSALVRLEQRGDARVMVATVARLAEGQRVRVVRDGAAWALEGGR